MANELKTLQKSDVFLLPKKKSFCKMRLKILERQIE